MRYNTGKKYEGQGSLKRFYHLYEIKEPIFFFMTRMIGKETYRNL